MEIINLITNNLDTQLIAPEEMVIRQGDIARDMFFIQQGECVVQIRDHNCNFYNNLRVLLEGDHFGEISMIYSCKRTCSVVSKNYTKLARMIRSRFIQVNVEKPNLILAMISHINSYRDPLKNFLERVILKVPFFRTMRNSKKSLFNELLYTINR